MSYRILDDPLPGRLAQVAVNPLWPLLAVMFGGSWLSWPWFALNGFAVGSPTRKRELALAVGGFAGTLGLAIGLGYLAGTRVLTGVAVQYAFVSLTVWKLAVSYLLFHLQNRSFHLYEYYGGTVRNGLAVALLGGFLARRPVLEAVDSALWRVVLS